MAGVRIRELDPARDHPGLRSCTVQLQDFERALDPRVPAGEEIADAYLALMSQRCREFDGVVLVAESGGAVVGFVTVWTRYRSTEPDDDPTPHAYVSDLVVAASHRRQGVARQLLLAAEARARDAGAPFVRLSVKAGNTAAISLYAAAGFQTCEIQLEKPLSAAEGRDMPDAVKLRDTREAVVRQHMQAENVHDFDAVIDTFAHPRYEIIATGQVHDGEAAVREYFRETRSAFPDQRNELIALHHADDAVIAEFWLLGTHRGTLAGVAPTGRVFRCRMAALFLFEGEKIVCERVYFDSATILRQLTS